MKKILHKLAQYVAKETYKKQEYYSTISTNSHQETKVDISVYLSEAKKTAAIRRQLPVSCRSTHRKSLTISNKQLYSARNRTGVVVADYIRVGDIGEGYESLLSHMKFKRGSSLKI